MNIIDNIKEKLSPCFFTIQRDFLRISSVILLLLFLGNVDKVLIFGEKYAYLSAVLSSVSIVLIISILSHLTRRIFFPSINLKEYAIAAKQEPLAASIVFMGVCIVLSTLVIANVLLIS
jgi:hypothetical protein